MQIERAGPAATDPGNREVVAAGDRVAQLAGEDAGTGEAETALVRGRWRDQQMEKIFGEAIGVELPGDDPGAGRRGLERCQFGRRAGDCQAVMQPVGMGQAQRGVAGDLPARRRCCRLTRPGRRAVPTWFRPFG
jgi:hypothetical protein